jgi:hypothetical protein
MTYRVYLPIEDESDDEVLRLPDAAAVALWRLLRNLSRVEMMERGLSEKECELVEGILHSMR